MPPLHAVIMAGGSGTRFWPASRTRRPKQFLPLANGQTLIGATVERLRGVVDPSRIWIITNPIQAAELPKVLPEFAASQIIIEPEARDTAPCVALATATIAARDSDAVITMLPADHVIQPVAAFQAMLQRGVELAADGKSLITFGITPDHPATGYGYIECGQPVDQTAPRARTVSRFREKPDRATAQGFLDAGNFLWNSGIFVWSTTALRAAMEHSSKDLAAAMAAMQTAVRQRDSQALQSAFRQAPKTSIDFAVMERAPRVVVVDATVRWDDVGSFPALTAIAPKDEHGNTALLTAGASFLQQQSTDNIVYAEGARSVALFGVSNLVVVAVGDAVLVCPKDRAADLKVLTEHLKAAGRSDLL